MITDASAHIVDVNDAFTSITGYSREAVLGQNPSMLSSGRYDDEVPAEYEGDQDLNAREDTRNAAGQELGADYMLKGQINTIIDAEGKEQVRYYQVDLTLISMADNRKVWLGQKKIKKYVKNAKLRY